MKFMNKYENWCIFQKMLMFITLMGMAWHYPLSINPICLSLIYLIILSSQIQWHSQQLSCLPTKSPDPPLKSEWILSFLLCFIFFSSSCIPILNAVGLRVLSTVNGRYTVRKMYTVLIVSFQTTLSSVQNDTQWKSMFEQWSKCGKWRYGVKI